MFIAKIGKRVSYRMISQLKNLFVSSPCGEKSSDIRKAPSFLVVKVQGFSNSGPAQDLKVAVTECKSSISLSVSRISRVARSEAQAALFDYLHSTRGFTYTDAEYVSKNSPHFLQSLISKVENEQDVSRALSRLFRFYPINEFEPFLESLGLRPSELTPLLPRNLMYLDDDHHLLGNFHLLCDYGIPRIKIGKIYKDATEIFRYEHGILAMKLKAYEKLVLSRTTVAKLVTCCPLILIGDVNKQVVGVFDKLKALGFGSDWIGKYLTSKNTYHWNRMLDTMTFLEEVGYHGMLMGDLIRRNPALLFQGSGKQIYVLVGRLLKLGLGTNVVYSLFLGNPDILCAKFVKNLSNALFFLFEIGMETEVIADIVTSHVQLLGSHSLKGPKTVLRNFNGDKQNLCDIIKEEPLKLFTLASKSNLGVTEQIVSKNPGKHVEKTTFLVKLGYVENSDEMAKALKQFRGRGDQLQERFDCLVQAGLDCNVVSDMIKLAPTALNQSKNVLEEKLSFLKSLGYPVESIVSFPSYLCYDKERIQMRFSMYSWLRHKGAVKPMISVSTLLACSDTRFRKYFVDVHPEGPAKWESLKESKLLS